MIRTWAIAVLYEQGMKPADRGKHRFYKKYADFKTRAKRGIAGLLPEGVPQIESDYGPEGVRLDWCKFLWLWLQKSSMSLCTTV